MEKMHHPKADVDRLYLPRTSGGRGLIQIETTYKTTTIGLDAYINCRVDRLIDIIREHERVRNTTSVHREAEKFKRELNTPDLETKLDEPATEYARRMKHIAKEQAPDESLKIKE